MKTRSYSQILDSIAKDQVRPDLDLAPAITAKIQKRKGFSMRSRMKLMAAILLVPIAFLIMSFTVPGVKAAIERWFGYIPGVGLVHEGQIRILAEPVKITREGVTVTVDQVIIDQERTTLIYSVDTIPADAILLQPQGAACDYKVSLRLPDGSQLFASPDGLQNWGSGYRHRFDYDPLPMNVNDVTLEIGCLFHTIPGTAPEDWEIQLHFIPAPPEMTVYPVIEIPVQTATPTSSTPPADTPAANTNPGTPLSLTLDRAVQMEDGYLLYASLQWDGTDFNSVDLIDPQKTVHLLDESGKELLYELRNDDQTGVQVDLHQTIIAIKTAPIQSPGPLTLVIDAVLAEQSADVSFEFNPGPDPKPGQVFEPDLEIAFGDRRLRIRSITAGQTGYSIEMSSDTGIRGAVIQDKNHQVVSGYGGESNAGNFFSGFDYDGGLPQDPLNLTISGISVEYLQKLEAKWIAPAVSAVQAPLSPTTCLNSEVWKAILQQQPVIPADLPERVLVYGPADQQNLNSNWEERMVNLDGSQRESVPDGRGDGSVSPDGSKLAYTTIDGDIRILDLASGETTVVPGTTRGDSNPMWTPDGKQLVFNRGMGIFDLFIVDPDGSNLRQLTQGGAQESTVGWMPDGSLLYSVPGEANGHILYQLDLHSAESKILSHESVHSISPDGRSLVIAELTFGDRWQTTVTDLDNKNRLLLNDNTLSVLPQIWSPDSQWILSSIADPATDSFTKVLINPRTCEIVPLLQLKDDVIAWIK